MGTHLFRHSTSLSLVGKNKTGWSELKIKLPRSLDVDLDQLRDACLSERITQMDCCWPSLPSAQSHSSQMLLTPSGSHVTTSPIPSLHTSWGFISMSRKDILAWHPCSWYCLLQMLELSEASLWARDSMGLCLAGKVWRRGQETGWSAQDVDFPMELSSSFFSLCVKGSEDTFWRLC